MDAVKLANETTTAVGNMKVNARGDKLGPGGQVIAGRNQVMDSVYSVAPRSGGYSPDNVAVVAAVKPVADVVEDDPADEAPVKNTAPKTRGSLASSVAKKG